MKLHGDCTRFNGEFSSLRRRWMRPLLAAAVTLVLFGHSISAHAAQRTSPSAQGTSPSRSQAHVFLLRGVLNIFSLGLDQIAARLEQQGIRASVSNYLFWSSVADEAAAEYKSGRTRTIILVGHSSGATILPDMVERLDKLGAPVKLAIGLDSVFQTSLSGRVGRYINFYIANGAGTPVQGTKQLQGKLENVDVERIPGVGHITIDKNEIMQQKVISAINSAL
jgi:hypothetical protein